MCGLGLCMDTTRRTVQADKLEGNLYQEGDVLQSLIGLIMERKPY